MVEYIFVNKSLINKIHYGLSETQYINVTASIMNFLEKNSLLERTVDLHQVIGYDPYPLIPKKLFVYLSNDELPLIINEQDGKLMKNIVVTCVMMSSISKITYGKAINESIDITDIIKNQLKNSNYYVMNVETNINHIIGQDPYPNFPKKIFIHLLHEDLIVVDEYDGHLLKNLVIKGHEIDYYFYIKSIQDSSIDNPNKVRRHYYVSGNALYDKKINIIKQLCISDSDKYYFYNIDDFASIYYPSHPIEDVYKKIVDQPKVEFRYFCFRYIEYIRQFEIPPLSKNNAKEAVLIEFRSFPHLEFTIRNTINKLGNKWNYTVVCGLDNEQFITVICNDISPDIRIIVYPYTNLNPDSYSMLLATEEFWNKFIGDKILIYQEDSCIFNRNIDEFLEYDFVGAPWPHYEDKYDVGNGGLSLRSKRAMLQIIEKKNILNTNYHAITKNYMENVNIKIPPEDVYFSKNIKDLKLGNIPCSDEAKKFSVESIFYHKPFGGHNFWLSTPEWKQKFMYKYVIIKVNYYHDMITAMNTYEHRGGWKYVINELLKADLYDISGQSKYNFIDLLENFCIQNRHFSDMSKPCICLVHGTINKRLELQEDWYQLSYLLNNSNYLNIKQKIVKSFTFSNYVREYLINHKYFTNVTVLIHPVEIKVSLKFDLKRFINNGDKCIIQIGQQLRYYNSIFRLNVPNLRKVWLPSGGCFEYFKNMYKSKKDVEIK